MYTLGMDFGTNSVRAVVVSVRDGAELATAVYEYEHGEAGVVTDSCNTNLARQHPADYLCGIKHSVSSALACAPAGTAEKVVGIGVDTTGSTPIPIDENGVALALQDHFKSSPNAMAWLWKDHTSIAEAEEITARAAADHPEYLAKCGGRYSSEWFWAKLLRCARYDADVFNAAHTWVELADWVPAILCGRSAPAEIQRCICAAGHKAMFNSAWGGYPAREFVGAFDNGVLLPVLETLPSSTVKISESVGGLSADWARELGLRPGIPIAAGAFDAHLGAVGSGIGSGTMVKVIGTSTCDLAVAPLESQIEDIPGLCGIVPESILPGHYGIEAGQSAVGDIFNWFANRVQPGGGLTLEELSSRAAHIKPGASGLLALDWHNGNRTVLVDQDLTGLIVGMNLHTSPAEIYRSLIEATAFGARAIRDRMRTYGVEIERVINCGGISRKSPLLMQIYADVFNCPMLISSSEQTCALGAAMAAAVVAGAHSNFDAAIDSMTSVESGEYTPDPESAAVYDRLYDIYKELHDSFGTPDHAATHFGVMKNLISIREEQKTTR